MLSDYVEPAFRSELFAALGHQAHRMRLRRKRYFQHLACRRHLEIQRFRNFSLQSRHVVVADVATVLAQVSGDAVRARLDREQRRAHRVWIGAGPRVAQRSNVIDVNSEAQRRMWHAGLAGNLRDEAIH